MLSGCGYELVQAVEHLVDALQHPRPDLISCRGTVMIAAF
jgi:hypothetical protein